MKKLLDINRKNGITTRASISEYESGFTSGQDLPTINELDNFFREAGVDLAAQACVKATNEWGGETGVITQTVAVTYTSQCNPGYGLLVARKLGIASTAEQILMQGVGCAGGLAILRTAAKLACSAAARRRPARVLAFACKLCTPNARHVLAEAEACSNPEDICVAGALFSDGAAAVNLCNEDRMPNGDEKGKLFRIVEWGAATVPDTTQHIGFYTCPTGYRTVLTRNVAEIAKKAIRLMFESLLRSFRKDTGLGTAEVADFDWALHPGGQAIINGAQQMLGLTDEQLRATREMYRTQGNASSAAV